LSVCPICLLHFAAAGLLLWAQRAGHINQLLPAAQQQKASRLETSPHTQVDGQNENIMPSDWDG